VQICAQVDYVKDPNTVVQIGQKVKVRVLQLGPAPGKFSLTMKTLEEQELNQQRRAEETERRAARWAGAAAAGTEDLNIAMGGHRCTGARTRAGPGVTCRPCGFGSRRADAPQAAGADVGERRREFREVREGGRQDRPPRGARSDRGEPVEGRAPCCGRQRWANCGLEVARRWPALAVMARN
jgi:hypothetical protein